MVLTKEGIIIDASGFTRQEALSLTGITSGKLSYLEATGLVVPRKTGNPKHPLVVYSAEQIIDLSIIIRLREKLSLEETGKVIAFFRAADYEPSLFLCHLIFLESEFYVIRDWQEFGNKLLELLGANKGKVVVYEIGKIGEILPELRTETAKGCVLDFEKRIQDTPLVKILKKNSADKKRLQAKASNHENPGKEMIWTKMNTRLLSREGYYGQPGLTLQDACELTGFKNGFVRDRLEELVAEGRLASIPGSGRRPAFYILPSNVSQRFPLKSQ